jgi:uncharacterized protein
MAQSTGSDAPCRRIAVIKAPKAERYISQLCRKFANKLPVSFDRHSAHIVFTMGDCRLSAQGGFLTLSLEAQDEASVALLEQVVARHLPRFAVREKLAVDWRAA